MALSSSYHSFTVLLTFLVLFSTRWVSMLRPCLKDISILPACLSSLVLSQFTITYFDLSFLSHWFIPLSFTISSLPLNPLTYVLPQFYFYTLPPYAPPIKILSEKYPFSSSVHPTCGDYICESFVCQYLHHHQDVCAEPNLYKVKKVT